MTGNEIITITIEEPDLNKKAFLRYSVMEADLFCGTKGEYHLMMIDYLVEKYNKNVLDSNSSK
jgi:hypothetical protein